MGILILILFLLFFWFFLIRRSRKRMRRIVKRRGILKPHYDLSDPCPKRRGEPALCGYCPLFDTTTGECQRGRWRSG